LLGETEEVRYERDVVRGAGFCFSFDAEDLTLF
jgi:hypothetical protein